MNMYDVYIPDLNIYVKFKVLDALDTESFVDNAGQIEDITLYKKLVLENYVFNLRTEVLERLKTCSPSQSELTLDSLYNACVQLNPGLDIDTWVDLAFARKHTLQYHHPTINLPPGIMEDNDEEQPLAAETDTGYNYKDIKPYKLTKTKYVNLGKILRASVIGQDEAIDALEGVLKRSQAGLNDPDRPLGVLLFAGSSGTGKTLLAKTLHSYLFGDKTDIIRVDCGELQHKHENQKLLGAPPGYLGHDKGGGLTNSVMENPYSVILLDEVEKAHPDIFNTFLRIFAEGLATDSKGQVVSFRNCVIIMTTNLGNKKLVDDISASSMGFNARLSSAHEVKSVPRREVVERETKDAIKKHFTPEFLNRVDDVLVFNHLSNDDFKSIAELELSKVDAKLARKGIRFTYDDSVVDALVDLGTDTVRGARGIERVRRDKVEDVLADKILLSKIPRGSLFEMTYAEDAFAVRVSKPVKKAESA